MQTPLPSWIRNNAGSRSSCPVACDEGAAWTISGCWSRLRICETLSTTEEPKRTCEDADSAFTGVAIAVGTAVRLVKSDEDAVSASEAEELEETEGLSSCDAAG